ncbi:MAG: pyridoxamine 5'-phosphate oxidase family protein [Gilvibacter sp.]
MLTKPIKQFMDASVLSWLATCSATGEPNVSPKELFTYGQHDTIVIANIASPQTIRNIKANPKVCMSFVEVFVQKGYQIKGLATLVKRSDDEAKPDFDRLQQMAGDAFKVDSLIRIQPESIKEILAPSYQLHPDTQEAEMIAQAMKTYKVVPNYSNDG